jgi:hypothetical protein
VTVARAEQGTRALLFKDEILDRIAETANVAQFVSFAPGLPAQLRRSRIRGFERNTTFPSTAEAVGALLERSVERSVNVRSFHPAQPQSHDFVYGIGTVDEAVATVSRLAAAGLHTIVNETIDVNDGGVSGVSYGGVVEFAPEDTPRCVEKPGTAALPRTAALCLLETVYGFRPQLDYPHDTRVEFSLHPIKRGLRNDHTIVWEEEEAPPVELRADLLWPNRFSTFIGDKTFGLAVADSIGLPVPRTTAITRRIAPFTFGSPTGTGEHWLRTAPAEQAPGEFTTVHGWVDPFALLQREDGTGGRIAAVLAQEAVEAEYSGAVIATSDGDTIVEGVRGGGDAFMLGERGPEQLPQKVLKHVCDLYARASKALGPVRFEWVHDLGMAWILQLHKGSTATSGTVIVPGTPTAEHPFEVSRGLSELRTLVDEVAGTGAGIVLRGHVGVTSHFGDVLRRANVPARLEPLS